MIGAVLFWTLSLTAAGYGGGPAKKQQSDNTAAVRIVSNEDLLVQGEARFKANCGRCHAAPQKFPPRMMKTVLRHMRVRATITEEDMKLVLFYMTQ